jgi:sugar transferase (PEP-CTERM/EpsH1 system associated)
MSAQLAAAMKDEGADLRVAAVRPLRVLHVVDALTPGGVPTLLSRLVERTQGDLEHAVCCLRELGQAADRLRAAGVPVHFLGKRNGHDWTLVWRIARLCRALQPRVVHTHNWGTIDGIIGARLARVPVVVHGEHGRDAANVAGEPSRRTLTRRALAPFIDRIVAVSDHLRDWQVDEVGIRADKVIVVRNGVGPYKPRNGADRERLRAAHGLSAAGLLIGAAGRLDSVKNYSLMLEAFRAVSARHPSARLIILGEGPQRPLLEKQIACSGLAARVHLAGHCEDVAEWLAAMDVFVQSSLMEGTANAILEAMAAGLPVVATSVGGTTEVVVDGDCGRLVPAGDGDALAEALAFYCSSASARTAHGAAGRARVERHYSLAATASQYTALYGELVGAKSARRRS